LTAAQAGDYFDGLFPERARGVTASHEHPRDRRRGRQPGAPDPEEGAAAGLPQAPDRVLHRERRERLDCLTSGNHIWDKKEILGFVDLIPQLLRPANYPRGQPGRGAHVGKSRRSGVAVATLNLSGRVFMNGALDDPFHCADEQLERLRKEAAVIVVDVHGEASSEKTALGHHLDGRVAAVFGTHTHVPTCDHRILPKGTAYITDLGMTGPYDSVIGVEKAAILQRFITGMPTRFETAKGDPRLAAAVIDADPETGRARGIERMLLAEGDLDSY
jgi:metallophosphoesterase (TIGR00282 family)